MKTFSFIVILDETDFTDEDGERLFNAGCSDATPGVFKGRAYVAFDREAPCRSLAHESALSQIEKAGLHPSHLEATI